MPPIKRLLIANRGEIAVRIIRACREMGIESIAVYSTADARAPHVRAADRAMEIGPPAAALSYLAVDRLLDAAARGGADAIHPGYGFLSENAAFAAACAGAGLTFVGPPAEVIARMGSKMEARAVMTRAGVPIVPGEAPDDQTDAGVQRAAEGQTLPVLVKASAGGGGKGMRLVRRRADLAEAIAAARREATTAFGDGTLYVERLIERGRHVEVQVFGDAAGNIVHLFERDCSVQRRHQKIVEESPSPALTPALRGRMEEAAIAAARAAGYVNAGTIEFLVEGEGDGAQFYFLEMNTRLQVEHAVTELVAGVDLVRAQLAVAGGAPLPWRQDALVPRGHAIECRVYAEDPARGFLPQAGRVQRYRAPGGPGIRVDAGIEQGTDVPLQYDPLLAKIIASAETREQARARARDAIAECVILGVRTNLALLRGVLDHPSFCAGAVHTTFVDDNLDALLACGPAADELVAAAAAAAAALHAPDAAGDPRPGDARPAFPDPWQRRSRWRLS